MNNKCLCGDLEEQHYNNEDDCQIIGCGCGKFREYVGSLEEDQDHEAEINLKENE